jgi:hypothetical protein
VTLALEAAPAEWSPGFARSVAFRPLLFAGVGWARFADADPAFPSPSLTLGDHEWVHSAGVGLEFGLRSSPVRLRVDLPAWVSEPLLASSAREDSFGFRVQLAFEPPRWAR